MVIVGQSSADTLMGERHIFGDSGSPCSLVRAAPLNQMEEPVVESGVTRSGDLGRRIRRRDRGGGRGVTTKLCTHGTRRQTASKYGGEVPFSAAKAARRRMTASASAHMQCDAPQRPGRADDGSGHDAALASATGAATAEAIFDEGGPIGVNLIAPTTQRAERVGGAVAHPCAARRRLTLMDVNRFSYVHTSFPFDPEVMQAGSTRNFT